MNVLDYRREERNPNRWQTARRILVFIVAGGFSLYLGAWIVNFVDIYRTKNELDHWMKQLPPRASSAQVFAMFRQKGMAIEEAIFPPTDGIERDIGGEISKGSHVIMIRPDFDPKDHLIGWSIVDAWRGP